MGVLHISDSDFDEKVIRSATPVLVDFWAEWCGPCRIIGPVLEDLAPEYKGRLAIAKINVDDNRETATRDGVSGIPTLILFKEGEAVDRQVGALPKPKLKEWIDRKL